MSTITKQVLTIASIVVVINLAGFIFSAELKKIGFFPEVQSTQTVHIEAGWKTLDSEPTPINATNWSIGIIIAAFSDKKTGSSPLAFAHVNSFTTAKSPDPRTGNKWSIGDEVYVIPVSTLNAIDAGGAMLPSTTFFIIDWRKKANATAEK